jgi:hypothetical protein
MPGQTHKENCRAAASFFGDRRVIGFELGRWQVTERRVKALVVVDFVQKLSNRSARFRQVAVFIAMHLFVLQRLHE